MTVLKVVNIINNIVSTYFEMQIENDENLFSRINTWMKYNQYRTSYNIVEEAIKKMGNETEIKGA